MGIPVASLVRVSTTGQAGDERGGLPRQRAAVGEAVRRHGLTVVRAFELPGVGGDRVSTTPAWAEIRALLAQGRIRGVVCDAVDRLCRASDLDLTVLADLQRHGASIWTPGEVRDLSSATDGLLAGRQGGGRSHSITCRWVCHSTGRRVCGAIRTRHCRSLSWPDGSPPVRVRSDRSRHRSASHTGGRGMLCDTRSTGVACQTSPVGGSRCSIHP